MRTHGGYLIRNQGGIHFVTFAVVEWVDVFTRKEYCNILLESLRHCQKHKGLKIYGWCIMSNHLHLIISSGQTPLSGILRDFKSYTSRKISAEILTDNLEPRKSWMLNIFEEQGHQNTRNPHYQFWRQDNRPMEIRNEWFFKQKLQYIHMNPVKAGIVSHEENYRYSSARDYSGKEGLLTISRIEF